MSNEPEEDISSHLSRPLSILVSTSLASCSALATALREAADALEASPPSLDTTALKLDAQSALTVVGQVNEAVKLHGGNLAVDAALGGSSMQKIADALGVSETGVPVMLARNERLKRYATQTGNAQPRVSSRSLTFALMDLTRDDH